MEVEGAEEQDQKLPESSSLEREAGAREPPTPLAEEFEHVLARRAVGCLQNERGLGTGKRAPWELTALHRQGWLCPGSEVNPHPAAHREGALKPPWFSRSPPSGTMFYCQHEGLNTPQPDSLPHRVPGLP